MEAASSDINQDKTPLHDDGAGSRMSQFGPSYGTLQDGSKDAGPDEEPPLPPLTKKALAVGLGLVLVCTVSGALMASCLVELGHGVVPTLEMVAIGYAIQTVCLLPLVAVCFRTFREVSEDQLVWLLATGLVISLALLSGYQAALTLPGSVVVTVGLALFLLITFLLTWCCDCATERVFSLICLVSLFGLVLMAASAIRNSKEYGWIPVVSSRDVGQKVDVPREGEESDNGASVETALGTVAPVVEGEPDDGSDPAPPPQPQPGDSPEDNVMFAYCTLILAAILGALGSTLVHRRLHSLPLGPFLFWMALVGTALATLEMALFSSPALPPSSKTLPFVGFLVLFNIAILALHVTWRTVPPCLFALVSALSAILYLIMARSSFKFEIAEPSIGANALEIIGAIFVFVASVAGPVWIFRSIHLEQQT